jgi:hypothetical protein
MREQPVYTETVDNWGARMKEVETEVSYKLLTAMNNFD